MTIISGNQIEGQIHILGIAPVNVMIINVLLHVLMVSVGLSLITSILSCY